MSFAAMLTQTATFLHRETSGADAEGNSTFDEPTTTSYPCRLEQTDSVEVLEGERRAVSNLLLFLPAAAVAQTFEDELLVDGVSYQVQGQPAVLRRPQGIHHVEARVRTVA